jgi:hypothetical protein
MIVGEPHCREAHGEVTVEAAAELERPGAARLPKVWFTFPERLGAFVSTRADGFAAALLPIAMRAGENLTVHGELSCRLAHGLREYVRYQATWKPDLFRAVELRCDTLASRDPGDSTGAVGTAFSGGVDSFHTLLTHLGDAEPIAAHRITHCVMIDGFDADQDLAGTGWFARLERLYAPRLATLGVELVVVRTNLIEVYGRALQKQAFGASITAPALVLGRLFSRYYVPSSYRFTHLARFYDGSHPMFDHLLGTESMAVVHDAGTLTRVEKTVALARRTEARDLLRACFERTGVQAEREAVANCCVCEKCIRTMTTLELAGALREFRCFPQPLELAAIRRCDYSHPSSLVFAEEILDFAARSGRRDIARALRWAIVHSALYRGWIRAIMQASYRLEQRSPGWAALVRGPKRLVQRTGLGRGWLYLRRLSGSQPP